MKIIYNIFQRISSIDFWFLVSITGIRWCIAWMNKETSWRIESQLPKYATNLQIMCIVLIRISNFLAHSSVAQALQYNVLVVQQLLHRNYFYRNDLMEAKCVQWIISNKIPHFFISARKCLFSIRNQNKYRINFLSTSDRGGQQPTKHMPNTHYITHNHKLTRQQYWSIAGNSSSRAILVRINSSSTNLIVQSIRTKKRQPISLHYWCQTRMHLLGSNVSVPSPITTYQHILTKAFNCQRAH